MTRPAPLAVSQLEAREVPAAAVFADIVPGVWGSYPQSLTASGTTLFFTAEDRNGRELWATDGTPAGTRLVKDINPGRAASIPDNLSPALFPAGNGVVYFGADDGTGRTVWKSDGTAAGTVKVTGLPPDVEQSFRLPWTSPHITAGWKGELYAISYDRDTQGVAQRVTWWKTNGTGFTVLADLTPALGPPGSFVQEGLRVNGDRLELTLSTAGQVTVWQTDGTSAGTSVQQANLTATSPTTGTVSLAPGVPLSPGRFVFTSAPDNGSKASLWVGDGTTTRTLVRAFDASPYTLYLSDVTAAGGKAYFTVNSNSDPRPADVGLWVTDGTVAGTRKLDVPTTGGLTPVLRGVFGGRAVVEGYEPNGGRWVVHLLTDGITSTPVPRPAGAETAGWSYVGAADGTLLFQNAGGQAYRTDGTAAGTALMDTTGLPVAAGVTPVQYWNDGKAVTLTNVDRPFPNGFYNGVGQGAYFNGAVYYSGRTDTQRAELWKWDLAGQTTPPPPVAPPPTVTGVRVNDGTAQRSVVRSVTITFDAAVNVNPAGVSVINVRGDRAAINQQLSTASGGTTLTITFPTGLGGSVADGRWTVRIDDSAVTRQAGGRAMAADYSFTFTRLFGDLTGDGRADRQARLLVRRLLGVTSADPRFDATLDVNGDGKIDVTDETAVVRNWGRVV